MNDEALLRSLAVDVERKDIDSFVSKCHADVEFEPLISQIEGGVYRGHDAVRGWWEQRERALEIDLADLEIRQVAAAYLLTMAMSARGQGSKAPVLGQLFAAVIIREGKVAWWAVFQDEQAAVERAAQRSEEA